VLNRAGSLFTLFFTGRRVTDYSSALGSDTKAYARFFGRMLASGIYLAPSQFEANFVSFAHSAADRRRTFEAFRKALARV
jgi:glutamate-1-semialdehyde 2,1-aminomutase